MRQDPILKNMKVLLPLLLLVLAAGVSQAMSVEEIGKLSDLKTGDELMLQLIEKNGLDAPITTADVIYLREHGASERVIQYLLKLSESPRAEKQPAVQEESSRISENLRAYTTTTKSGKKVRVVTNLDENGQRMGAPVPPPPPEEVAAPTPPPPQEVRVTVNDDRMQARDAYEDDYAYDQEPQPEGIPLYYGGGYPYSSWYGYPYSVVQGGMHGRQFPQSNPGWRPHPLQPVAPPRYVSRPNANPPARAASLPTRRSR